MCRAGSPLTLPLGLWGPEPPLRVDRGLAFSPLPLSPGLPHHRCVVPPIIRSSRALQSSRGSPQGRASQEEGPGGWGQGPHHTNPWGTPRLPARLLPSFRGRAPPSHVTSSLVTRVHLPGGPGSRGPRISCGQGLVPSGHSRTAVATPGGPALPAQPPLASLGQLQPLPPQPSQPRPPRPETAEKMPVCASYAESKTVCGL